MPNQTKTNYTNSVAVRNELHEFGRAACAPSWPKGLYHSGNNGFSGAFGALAVAAGRGSLGALVDSGARSSFAARIRFIPRAQAYLLKVSTFACRGIRHLQVVRNPCSRPSPRISHERLAPQTTLPWGGGHVVAKTNLRPRGEEVCLRGEGRCVAGERIHGLRVLSGPIYLASGLRCSYFVVADQSTLAASYFYKHSVLV